MDSVTREKVVVTLVVAAGIVLCAYLTIVMFGMGAWAGALLSALLLVLMLVVVFGYIWGPLGKVE